MMNIKKVKLKKEAKELCNKLNKLEPTEKQLDYDTIFKLIWYREWDKLIYTIMSIKGRNKQTTLDYIMKEKN